MSNEQKNREEQGRAPETNTERVTLDHFERSPRLAELKVAYRSRTKAEKRQAIRGPQDVERYLRAIWNKRTLELVEEFLVVCLNGSHEAIGWVKVSTGGLGSTIVDPRVVFAIALQTASSALIVAHNHPSGSLVPSSEDQAMTRRLKEAGMLLGINVLDHVILTREGSFSFADRGML